MCFPNTNSTNYKRPPLRPIKSRTFSLFGQSHLPSLIAQSQSPSAFDQSQAPTLSITSTSFFEPITSALSSTNHERSLFDQSQGPIMNALPLRPITSANHERSLPSTNHKLPPLFFYKSQAPSLVGQSHVHKAPFFVPVTRAPRVTVKALMLSSSSNRRMLFRRTSSSISTISAAKKNKRKTKNHEQNLVCIYNTGYCISIYSNAVHNSFWPHVIPYVNYIHHAS